MKVAVTGATGLIGSRLVPALAARGDEVIVLSRDASRAAKALPSARVVEWDPSAGPAPSAALEGVDGVINFAGEPVAQRWSAAVKERIRDSRVVGTARLVQGLAAVPESGRPRVLLSTSAAGYYGDRGSEPLEETASPAEDFLAKVCVDWEDAAEQAADLGIRVVKPRIGVVLDGSGGALKAMRAPFKAGIGGPIAGGRQYTPWIALDDVVGIYLAALDGGPDWSGAVNVCAPTAVTNADFSRALGRALHRPAIMPVPLFVLRARYGEMASMVAGSQRMVPARALALGYGFRRPELADALAAALS